jgi:hypothetical protein
VTVTYFWARRRLNRAAHSLIRFFRFMNLSSGSEGDLYVANPNARAHFERVRLSTFAGSAVQRMMAANGF